MAATNAVLAPSVHQPRDPIIVSTNRFLDIAPYVTQLYIEEPDKYGSVFPWDWPQPASKENEEHFLLNCFGEREVHIQGGGAHGFRFLKQVWLTCAKWNIEHKIPAMVQWWFSQKSNQEVVEDTSLRKFICRDDAKPSAFFGGNELKECGEKCLRLAMQQIQSAIKDMSDSPVAKRQTPVAATLHLDPSSDALRDRAASGRSSSLVDTLVPSNDYAISPEVGKMHRGLSLPVQGTPPARAQLVPSPPEERIKMPEKTNDRAYVQERPKERTFSIEKKMDTADVRSQQPRKQRGGYNGGRGSMRGRGNAYVYPRHNENNSPMSIPPAYFKEGPPPGHGAPDRARRLSNTFSHSHQTVPFGFAEPERQIARDRHASQHSQQQHHRGAFTSYGTQYQQAIAPQPVYFSNSQMAEQSYRGPSLVSDGNHHHPIDPRTFSSGSQPPHVENIQLGRGPRQRRDSSISRGGRGRGSFGSGGHASFNHPQMLGFRQDPADPFVAQPGQLQRMPVSASSAHSPIEEERRRGSITSNWRIRDSTATDGSGPKKAPERYFSDPSSQGPPWPPSGQPQRASGSYQYPPSLPPGPGFVPAHDPNSSQGRAFPEQVVTRHSFGAACTYITKLVVFDTLGQYTDSQIQAHFPLCTKVSTSTKSNPGGLRFLQFEDHLSALHTLQNCAEAASRDGLRLEVPKQMWDRDHTFYPGYDQSRNGNPPTILARPPPNGHAPGLATQTLRVEQADTAIKSVTMPKGEHTTNKTTQSYMKDQKPAVPAEVMQIKSLNTNSVENQKGGASQGGAKQGEARSKQVDETSNHKVSGEKHNTVTASSSGSIKVLTSDVIAPNNEPTTDAARKQSIFSNGAEPAQTKLEPALSPVLTVKAQLPLASGVESMPNSVSSSEAGHAPFRAAQSANPIDDKPKPARQTKKAKKAAKTSEDAGMSKVSTVKADGTAQSKVSTGASLPHSGDAVGYDSFHTATASLQESQASDRRIPSSSLGKDADRTGAVPQATESTPTKGASEASTTQATDGMELVGSLAGSALHNDKIAVVTPIDAQPSATGKQVGSAANARSLNITVVEPVEHEKTDVKAEGDKGQRRASGTSSIPPTPGFQTAPSTPANKADAAGLQSPAEIKSTVQSSVTQTTGAPKQADTDNTNPAAPAKKIEKPKGPPQTESLSMFAKQTQKKPKPAKKGGTMKVKPKMNMDFTEGPARNRSKTMPSGADLLRSLEVDQKVLKVEKNRINAPERSTMQSTSQPTKSAKLGDKSVEVEEKTRGTPNNNEGVLSIKILLQSPDTIAESSEPVDGKSSALDQAMLPMESALHSLAPVDKIAGPKQEKTSTGGKLNGRMAPLDELAASKQKVSVDTPSAGTANKGATRPSKGKGKTKAGLEANPKALVPPKDSSSVLQPAICKVPESHDLGGLRNDGNDAPGLRGAGHGAVQLTPASATATLKNGALGEVKAQDAKSEATEPATANEGTPLIEQPKEDVFQFTANNDKTGPHGPFVEDEYTDSSSSNAVRQFTPPSPDGSSSDLSPNSKVVGALVRQSNDDHLVRAKPDRRKATKQHAAAKAKQSKDQRRSSDASAAASEDTADLWSSPTPHQPGKEIMYLYVGPGPHDSSDVPAEEREEQMPELINRAAYRRVHGAEQADKVDKAARVRAHARKTLGFYEELTKRQADSQ